MIHNNNNNKNAGTFVVIISFTLTKCDRELWHSRYYVLTAEELKDCSSCFIDAISLGMWIVSDFLPVIWSLSRSLGWKGGCSWHKIVQITKQLLYLHIWWLSSHCFYINK